MALSDYQIVTTEDGTEATYIRYSKHVAAVDELKIEMVREQNNADRMRQRSNRRKRQLKALNRALLAQRGGYETRIKRLEAQLRDQELDIRYGYAQES
jgi:hypothetical protein